MSFGKRFADWGVDEDESLAIVKTAVEAGINFFDTADVYGRGESEAILGRALKTLGLPREELVVATKVFGTMGETPNTAGLSRKHIMQAADASLKRLQVDYIDLYQIHRFDFATPIEETIEALDDLVRAGKVLYLGASSMFAYQFAKCLYRADQLGRRRFAMMQNHYNLLYREEEREMIPLCLEEGIGLVPWSPRAGGRLTGHREAGTKRSTFPLYRRAFSRPADEAVIEALKAVAEDRGESPAQVATSWVLAKPGVTAPIVGATKASQLADAIRAVDSPLSAEEIERLETPYVAQAVNGPYAPEYSAARLQKFSERS
jgi:aryl-alcohol dehydrogenase (NADP+)